MIPITPAIALAESEIHFDFVRSSGAGGQNVNKVSTAVQLRFDAANSQALAPEVRERLVKIAGSRMTGDGVLILKAQSFRTQERNRQDALERLIALIRQAAHKPTIRRPTKPSRASQQRRLEAKSQRSQTKQARRSLGHED